MGCFLSSFSLGHVAEPDKEDLLDCIEEREADAVVLFLYESVRAGFCSMTIMMVMHIYGYISIFAYMHLSVRVNSKA